MTLSLPGPLHCLHDEYGQLTLVQIFEDYFFTLEPFNEATLK